MAKTPTRSEEETYRIPFFILASLLAASTIWLVYQEFFTRRPWKNEQLGWFKVERARAEKNLESEKKFLKEGTITKKSEAGEEVEIKVPERIAELEKMIEDLEGSIINSPRRVEYERLKADLAKAEVEVKDKEVLLAFAKADEDEYYYYYRHAKHEGHEHEEKELEKKVDELHHKVGEASRIYDEAVAKRDAITDKIDAIQKQIRLGKKELDELKAGLVLAERAAEQTRGFSLLRVGIEQHWNQDIELVDRCHTCHMGIERCGFSAPEEILNDAVKNSLAPNAIRAKYCVTREEADAYAKAAEEVQDSFGEEKELGFEDVKDKLMLDTEPVLASAAKVGKSPESAEEAYRTHPNRTGLLATHPGGTFGCTTCHYGEGRRTKGVGLNYLKGDMAPFDHARNDHYWISQQLNVKNHQVEASCYNCHKNDYELDNAPNLTEARKMVQHLGCTGCHPLGAIDPVRKHGPTLNKAAEKIDPGWITEWIKHPKAIRPKARMPNFWPEVTKKPGEAPKCTSFDYATGNPPTPAIWMDCKEKRDQEVGYISAYLYSISEKTEYPALPANASAERGKEVFESVGCMGCHNLGTWQGASTLPGSKDRTLAPNLTGVGDKIKDPGWFYKWVTDPKAYWPETRMPQLRLSEQEAWDVAAFLAAQKTPNAPKVDSRVQAAMDEEGAAEKGRKLVSWYGCFGCHEIKSFENSSRIGAELVEFGSKPPSKLDFGDVPEFVRDPHAQTWDNWIRRKLKDPRGYRYERVETRMPEFELSPEEIEKAVLFLKGNNNQIAGWPEDIRYKQTPEKAAMQRGLFLVDAYNCRGCHMIDDTGVDVDNDHRIDGGALYRWFAANPDEKFRSPPKLINQGRKVYPDWLFGFLKQPFKLRENYRVRMPTFQLSDQEASDLVSFFAAKAGSKYPFIEKKHDTLNAEDASTAQKLFADAQCLNCHNLDGVSKDPKQVSPNLRLTAERLQYDWLFDWLKDPQVQAPGVGMPGFFIAKEDQPGEYETPLPEHANGDWRRQIELLRAYVIGLGKPEARPLAQNESAPAAAPRRR